MELLNVVVFDKLLSNVVVMLLAILLLGLFIKRLNQPYVVAYIIAGILLGPFCFKVFTEADTVSGIGEFGVIIQMFFIGTKMEIHHMRSQIKTPVAAVIMQLLLSFLLTWAIGYYNHWSLKEVFLFTCIISLSSSAIIFDYLEKNNELTGNVGFFTSSVLVLQDLLFVPMLMFINLSSNNRLSIINIFILIAAGILITLFLNRIHSEKAVYFNLPFNIENDHEAQVFIGLLVCFGFAWLTQLINLTASLGALLGGIFVSRINSLQWLERHLVPFRVFFLSLFFLAIGLQVNLPFFQQHLGLILSLTAGILVINSVINAVAFRLLSLDWRNSIYAGALLSQIGEFSLVLCLAARSQELVNEFWYQLTLAVISLTMLLTAAWIKIIRSFIYKRIPTLDKVYKWNS
jgi:CPA2 family monovalent cation:H+ antiporter-2